MLDFKKHRLDYGAMLVPPSGYRLAKAVAATYTLDLNTLLSIPVALFFFLIVFINICIVGRRRSRDELIKAIFKLANDLVSFG